MITPTQDDFTLIRAEFEELRAGQYEVWRAVLAKETATSKAPMEFERVLYAAFCSGFDVGVMAARVGRN